MNDGASAAAIVPLVLAGIATLVVASYPLHLAIACRRARSPAPEGRAATLSVIVPLCGEEEGLRENLASIARQTGPAGVQIVFVAEHADDPGLAIARSIRERATGARIQIVVAGEAGADLGKAHNLSAGLGVADGDTIAFLDSDARPPDDRFVARVAAALRDPRVGLVTCVPGYRGPHDAGAALIAALVNTDVAGLFGIHAAWGRMTLANGTCMALRADVLKHIGGVDWLRRRLLMDSALARRVVAHGYRVALHPEPIPIHREHLPVERAWAQAHRWHVAMRFGLPWPAYLGLGVLRAGGLFACCTFLLVPPAIAAIAVSIAAATRILAAGAVARVFAGDRMTLPSLMLVPFADLCGTAAWAFALAQPTVAWRGERYRVRRGASVLRLSHPAPRPLRAPADRTGRPPTLEGSLDP